MQNERYDNLRDRLRSFSLTYHQYLILQLPFYEPRNYKNFPGYARALAPFGFDMPTDDQCFRAMERLLGRGLVDLVTSESLKRIKLYLRCNSARGPMAGLPYLGQLDLTLAGFGIWEQLWKLNDRAPDEIQSVNYVYRSPRTAIIFACDEWAAYSSAADSDFTPIGEPIPIGPWRSNWWHLMPTGVSLRCLEPIDT